MHIGRHKTGSTAIQTFLSMQYAQLANLGFQPLKRSDYSDLSPLNEPLSVMQTNVFDLGNAFLRPNVENTIRARKIMPILSDAEQTNLAKSVNLRLKTLCQNKTLIMSAEAFSFYRTEIEKRYVKLLFLGFELNVLLIERDINDWIESYTIQNKWLAQHAKHLLDKPGSIFDFSDTGWQTDMTRLKYVFDLKKVYRYEDMVDNDGSVLPGFVNWLGLDPVHFKGWLNIKRNVSLKSEKNRPL